MQRKRKGILKKSITSIGLALCLANPTFADNPLKVRALRVQTSPVIDGKLDEWQQRNSISGFYNLAHQTPASLDSRVWLSYDNKNIYIAAHNRKNSTT